MKSLLVVALVLGSISVFSANDNKDIDMSDLWVSWCDSNKVVKSSEQNLIVKEDCAAAQKLCVQDQATRGRRD